MDVTPLIVRILSQALDDVQVSTEMPYSADAPSPTPRRYVLVDLAGDQSDGFLLRPRYALTCWGASDRDAHSIALACVDALRDAAMDDDLLSACQMESMSRDEWNRTGQSRYLVEVDLTVNTE